MMIEMPVTINVPIYMNEHGTIRVNGTRIPLQNIIVLFNRNETPEQIHRAFDTVPVVAIYAIIAWYLDHREMVDVYVAEQDTIEEAIWSEHYAQHPEQIGHTERLRNRIAARTLET